MYSPSQILRGLRQPDLAGRELGRQWQSVRTYLPHDIGVQGSYRTGNVGDRAIGMSIREQLEARSHQTKLFGKDIERSAAPTRILGGGGVLHDWYGINHLRSRLNFLSENGAVIGVGVPGFETTEARDLIAHELASIDLVTVRDEWSKERLEAVYDGDVQTTACPAFLHADPGSPSAGRTGVNFRPWFHLDKDVMTNYFDYGDGLNLDQARDAYRQNVAAICEAVPDPVFIPFHERDEQFAREHLDIDVLPYKFSVERTLKRVSAVDQMVAMRYHSLVFATVCETPTLAIAYEPKVSALAERVDISSYKPHRNVPVKFDAISNRDNLRNAAERNFHLLDAHLSDQ